MKNLLLIITLVFSLYSYAHDDLKKPMKVMGEQMNIIVKALQSRNLTENELVAIETMQTAIADSSLEYPHLATTDELKLKYSRWMAELMKLSLQLETDVELAMETEPQNHRDVIKTFKAMDDLRKEGHSELKPKEGN